MMNNLTLNHLAGWVGKSVVNVEVSGKKVTADIVMQMSF
jgi:hypothetical protein